MIPLYDWFSKVAFVLVAGVVVVLPVAVLAVYFGYDDFFLLYAEQRHLIAAWVAPLAVPVVLVDAYLERRQLRRQLRPRPFVLTQPMPPLKQHLERALMIWSAILIMCLFLDQARIILNSIDWFASPVVVEGKVESIHRPRKSWADQLVVRTESESHEFHIRRSETGQYAKGRIFKRQMLRGWLGLLYERSK